MLINQWVINRTFLILGLKPAMWVNGWLFASFKINREIKRAFKLYTSKVMIKTIRVTSNTFENF
jgi:hypothetical protein